MIAASALPSEHVGVVATVDPKTVVNVAQLTDVVDLSKWHSVIFIFLTGDMAAETIDCSIQYCDADGVTNVGTLKAATQLAASATANDNAQVILECNASDLMQISETKRYVRGRMITGGVAGGPAAVIALGYGPKTGVAGDNDLASVLEIARPA